MAAKLGARLIVKAITRQIQSGNSFPLSPPSLTKDLISINFWEKVQQEVLIQLEIVARNLKRSPPTPLKKGGVEEIPHNGGLEEIINNYFLFTVVGALITPLETVIFSIGDGVIAVNGKVTEIGSFPNNAPPYLAIQT